jgi:hypothetical protein
MSADGEIRSHCIFIRQRQQNKLRSHMHQALTVEANIHLSMIAEAAQGTDSSGKDRRSSSGYTVQYIILYSSGNGSRGL